MGRVRTPSTVQYRTRAPCHKPFPKLSRVPVSGQGLKEIARRLRVRDAAERMADSARLLVDTVSDPVYQPVRELGSRFDSADRAAGTSSRWAAMLPVLTELAPASATDLGCNAGWFTLQLGRMGISTVGIEGHPPYYRTALTAVRRSGLRNVAVMAVELTPETLRLLPQVDCTLFLSVWHHLVRADGLDSATEFLRQVWRHTDVVMFFETGEYEEFAGGVYNLPPMPPDAKSWLTEYLGSACEHSQVIHLGQHPSGPGNPATRNLFAVRRASGPRE